MDKLSCESRVFRTNSYDNSPTDTEDHHRPTSRIIHSQLHSRASRQRTFATPEEFSYYPMGREKPEQFSGGKSSRRQFQDRYKEEISNFSVTPTDSLRYTRQGDISKRQNWRQEYHYEKEGRDQNPGVDEGQPDRLHPPSPRNDNRMAAIVSPMVSRTFISSDQKSKRSPSSKYEFSFSPEEGKERNGEFLQNRNTKHSLDPYNLPNAALDEVSLRRRKEEISGRKSVPVREFAIHSTPSPPRYFYSNETRKRQSYEEDERGVERLHRFSSSCEDAEMDSETLGSPKNSKINKKSAPPTPVKRMAARDKQKENILIQKQRPRFFVALSDYNINPNSDEGLLKPVNKKDIWFYKGQILLVLFQLYFVKTSHFLIITYICS